MDFGHYAESAADLVNADLESVESLQAHLGDRDWLSTRVSPADLRPLRKIQDELRLVIDCSATGDEPGVVATLNELLAEHPVRPRISGHDSQSWHLHVNDSTDSVASILIGEALFGMAVAVTDLGADRFGWCADDSCGGAFFDGTANHSKRFCCSRCSTRANVAAYRQRKAAQPESTQPESTRPESTQS
jgi:predicted RNA-binding Zn ribbon-like protein